MQQSDSGVNPQAKVFEIEKAWLAGIIDGEGSIRVDYPHTGKSGSPRIVVTNTDWQIIERVVDICQRLDCNPHVSQRKGKRANCKDVLILGISKIFRLLPEIMPYLTGRKLKQAILLSEFCSSRMMVNVNDLPNSQRGYSQEDINRIYQIKQLMFSNTEPQRLDAKISGELANVISKDAWHRAGLLMQRAMMH